MYKSYTIPTTKTIRSRSRSDNTGTSTDFEKHGTARRHIQATSGLSFVEYSSTRIL